MVDVIEKVGDGGAGRSMVKRLGRRDEREESVSFKHQRSVSEGICGSLRVSG
jgi:hypothetical protein